MLYRWVFGGIYVFTTIFQSFIYCDSEDLTENTSDILEATLFHLESTFMEMIIDDRKEIKALKETVGELKEKLHDQEITIASLRRTVARQNDVILGVDTRPLYRKISRHRPTHQRKEMLR